LAKFVIVPIYNEAQPDRAKDPRRISTGEGMTSIEDLDLATYCGRIGHVYGRHHLCPPFALRHAAESWIARGIPLTHCLDVIERFLGRHAADCHSGSGDRNFPWLNSLIQTSWHERSFARPPRPSLKLDHEWLNEYGAEEPRQKPVHRAAFTPNPPNPVSEPGSFKSDAIALRQKAARAFSPARGTKSVRPQRRRNASRPSSQTQAPRPKKLEIAVAWLRTELASGERPAAEVEARALCAGIAPWTYDRARQRLGVTSRRIGFGRWAKYMIALPVLHGTPNAASTEAGVACPAQLSGNSKEARDVGQARKE
jgi:hypothetical protein